jgi:hypothetical protein
VFGNDGYRLNVATVTTVPRGSETGIAHDWVRWAFLSNQIVVIRVGHLSDNNFWGPGI